MALRLRNIANHIRPVVRSFPATAITRPLAFHNSIAAAASAARRNMATTAPETTPRKYEWLVVIPDFPGMLEKRREIRP
jgi:hypothetical protein